MSTVTSGSRLRGKESTGQCRDEGAAGPEGSRGHRGARGGAGLARASPSGHSPITKPQARGPEAPVPLPMPWLPLCRLLLREFGLHQNQGALLPCTPTRWGALTLPITKPASRE